MSSVEADALFINTFSKEHQHIEEEVRKEMNLNDSNKCTENLSALNLNDMTHEYVDDPAFVEEVEQILKTSGLEALFAEREMEAMQKKKSGKVSG